MAKHDNTRTAKQSTVTLINVYGPMLNLHTGQRIDGPTEVAEIDSFLQAQIDAGKLRIVE